MVNESSPGKKPGTGLLYFYSCKSFREIPRKGKSAFDCRLAMFVDIPESVASLDDSAAFTETVCVIESALKREGAVRINEPVSNPGLPIQVLSHLQRHRRVHLGSGLPFQFRRNAV